MGFFVDYLKRFEKEVIVHGAESGKVGKIQVISLRLGKLSTTLFGLGMGKSICSSSICAVDYYGYVKKSDGFFAAVKEAQKGSIQVKGMSAVTVHFGSLKIEKVAQLAPDLVIDFMRFKKMVLDLRGFDHCYGL